MEYALNRCTPPLIGHHWKNGSSRATCYYSTLDHTVSLPVMRADSIAQIAKALARLVLVVSPPFVILNFIVEWSKTVPSQNVLWTNVGVQWSDVVTWLFLTKLLSHGACALLCFDCVFLFCSITSVVDNLQQWPWVPYQHTPSSPFSSLSGGNNEDVCASPVSVCSSNGCFIACVCCHLNTIQ